MRYKELDAQWQFGQRQYKLMLAKGLGYSYITEMFHKLYLLHGSTAIVGDIIGVCDDNVRVVLSYMLVPLKRRGGVRSTKITKEIVINLKSGFKDGMEKKGYIKAFKKEHGLGVTDGCLLKALSGQNWGWVVV